MKRRAFKKKTLCKIVGDGGQVRTATINDQLDLVEIC